MNNKEEITKMVRGELTCTEAEQLYKKLYARSDFEVIQDLKELPLQNLLDTKDCIESGIKIDAELDNDEVRKSLRYLEIAIKEKIS